MGRMGKLALVGMASLCSLTVSYATEFEGIEVISLATVEGSAILKFPDNKMTVVHVGDKLPGTEVTVRQILSDRLVVEDLVDDTPPRSEIVWVYKSPAGSESKIRRLDSQGPKETVEVVEVMHEAKR